MPRREFLRLLGIAGAAIAAEYLLEGCTRVSAQPQQSVVSNPPKASVRPSLPSQPVPIRPSLADMTPDRIALQLEQIANASVVEAIVPHPDDAISAWSLLGHAPRLIVNLMTQGGQSVHCAENGGIGSGACKARRVDSWLTYFTQSGYNLTGTQPEDGYMLFEGESKDGNKKVALLLHDYPDQGLMPDYVTAAIISAEAYSQSVYGTGPALLADASYKYAYDNPAVAGSPLYRLYQDDYQTRPHPDHLATYEAVKQYVAVHHTLGGLAVNGPTIPAYNTQMWVSDTKQVLRNANAYGSYGWLSDNGEAWKWQDVHALTGLDASGQQRFDVFALPPTQL